MPFLTESSITLTFPDNNYFRLADCAGYKPLSAFHFKEMDACWYEVANNRYWLFELKDYTLATIDETTMDKRIWDMTKKAYDSLCFFLSSKHNYLYSADINPCLPYIPDQNTTFRFITIVHVSPAQRVYVQDMNNGFRNKFKPYASLFNINEYGVIEHSRATNTIPYSIVS